MITAMLCKRDFICKCSQLGCFHTSVMWMLGQGPLWSKGWSHASYSLPTTTAPQLSIEALVEMKTWKAKYLSKLGHAEMKTKLLLCFFWQNDSLFSSSMSGSHNTQHTQSDLCKCMEVEMYNGERRKRRCWGRTVACAVKVGAGEPELNQMKSGTDASLLQDGDAAAPNSTQNLGLSSCWKFYSRLRFKGSVNKRNHSLHTNNSNFL